MMNERERLRPYEELGRAIGPEHAGTLMELPPPSSWDDIATTEVVKVQGVQLRAEMAELRGDIGLDLARHLRMQVGANLATMLTLTALIVGLS